MNTNFPCSMFLNTLYNCILYPTPVVFYKTSLFVDFYLKTFSSVLVLIIRLTLNNTNWGNVENRLILTSINHAALQHQRVSKRWLQNQVSEKRNISTRLFLKFSHNKHIRTRVISYWCMISLSCSDSGKFAFIRTNHPFWPWDCRFGPKRHPRFRL